jgi:hypothetical protein
MDLPTGYTHDEPGCFDKVFFQWLKDGFAGRPQHIERLGIAYMYMGAWVPNTSGKTAKKEFHVGPTLWLSLRTQMSYRVSTAMGPTACHT